MPPVFTFTLRDGEDSRPVSLNAASRDEAFSGLLMLHTTLKMFR